MLYSLMGFLNIKYVLICCDCAASCSIYSRTYESLGNLSHCIWLGQSVMEKVSPAHDFMSQEHTAHLRILVLTFIYDGL